MTGKQWCRLPDFSIELQCRNEGHGTVGGIDEAGRGALAGPLAVALVIYPQDMYVSCHEDLACINDSKKISRVKRPLVVEVIKKHALWYDCVFIPPGVIDEKNINGATEIGIQSLIKRAEKGLDYIILDGTFRFSLPLPCLSVKGGDGVSLSVASASVIAKVSRDEIVSAYDEFYPGYKFGDHMGYGTLAHRRILSRQGPSPVHRKTYEPVASMLQYPVTLFDHEDK